MPEIRIGRICISPVVDRLLMIPPIMMTERRTARKTKKDKSRPPIT
jgi:hypothetical protein